MWRYNSTPIFDELYHYGVLGMKWGVRRYQNEDGSLTNAGKKRVSKKYERLAKAVGKKISKNYNRMYVNSYNKAADYMNKGGIDKFNEQQKKKYGDKFAERSQYKTDYMEAFEARLVKEFNVTLNNLYQTDKNYKKSKELVDRFRMTEWNELARQNEATIEELSQAVKKGI